MTVLHGATELATMKTAFPSMPMTLEGPQTLTTLLAIQQHLINCAQSFRVEGRPLGLLNLAIPAQVYQLYTADPYPARAVNPGDRPLYAGNVGQVARANIDNIFAVNYRNYHNEQNMDEALIDRLYSMLGAERAQDLRDSLVAMVNPSFLQACAQAIRLWGHTTPTTRDANWKTLKNAWHESEGMAKLWRQIKTAVTFAVAAGQPIPPEQIVDAALICINRTQAYKQSYLSYKQLPVRNYTTLKTHFEQAERDRIEVEDEAGQHGYGMNAMESADREMQRSLTDLATAITSGETANNNAVNNDPALVALVAQMQQTIAAQSQQLANSAQTAAPQQRQMPMMQMPTMQYCAPTMQQQPLQPINYNNQQNMGSNGGMKNPVKRYENLNYCHSCGYDIPRKHHSGNCPARGPNHNYAATRMNTMGGATRANHKTIMPSAAGKMCQDARDAQRNQKQQQRRNGRKNQQQDGYQQQSNGYQHQQQSNGYQNQNSQQRNGGYQQKGYQQQRPQQQQFGGYANGMPMMQQQQPMMQPQQQQQQPMMQQQMMPQQQMMQQQQQPMGQFAMGPQQGYGQYGNGFM